MKQIEKANNLKCVICSSHELEVLNSRVQDLMKVDKFAVLKCCNCGRVTTKDQVIDENN